MIEGHPCLHFGGKFWRNIFMY